MVGLVFVRPTCPACAGPTQAVALCPECFEAFAIARRDHPSTPGALPPAPVDGDLDMWDAWSVLGDVGGRA